jgi:hypothetical protein
MTTPTTLDQLFAGRAATVVPDAIGPSMAAALRARLDGRYARYALLDRGSYDVVAKVEEPALFTALAAIAQQVTGRTLAVIEARAIRLGPGDYLLAHHDRLDEDVPVELVVDVSPASVPGAEVHYRQRGKVYFRFASQPGSLSVVERGPTVMCNHTYVSKRWVGASVVRLIVLLRADGG